MKTDYNNNNNHSQLMMDIKKGSSRDEENMKNRNVRAKSKFENDLEKIDQKIEEIEAPLNPEIIIIALNELKEHLKKLTEEEFFLLDSFERIIKKIEKIYKNLSITDQIIRKKNIESKTRKDG